MHIYWICVLLVVSYSKGALHPVSPCPSVFSYEGRESEHDRWYGTVMLSADESLVGVRLDIKLDRQTQLLVSWLGEVSTEDNERFTILNLSQKLQPGPPLSSRIMVKFNATLGSPQLRIIRLNGRQICPPDPNFPLDIQTNYPSNSMKNQDAPERSTRRPDPDFEDNNNWGPSHQPPMTEYTVRTTKPYNSESNHPKRENNFYHENTATHPTTKTYNDNEEDHSKRPNNYNHNTDYSLHEGSANNNEQLSSTRIYNNVGDGRPLRDNYNQQDNTRKTTSHNRENEESPSNGERFSSTEPYSSVGENRPGSINHIQQKTTLRPNYEENNNNNDRLTTTERYNSVREDRPGLNNYNQQKPTHKPNYQYDNEGTNYNDEQSSTTERNHYRGDRPGSNDFNQQKTTYKPNHENGGIKNNDERPSTTERNKNVRDSRPGLNQQKTANKPSYQNETRSNNNNEQFSSTEKPNKLGSNQQKTTRKPSYNVNGNKYTTPKPTTNKGGTMSYQSSNKNPPKSEFGSDELQHLSTSYQVSYNSNKYPTTSTKYKNETSSTKGTNSNSGKTTRVTGKDSVISSSHKSESNVNGDLETERSTTGCGKVEIPPAPLITNGQNTARGQWPWHIALYKIEGINLSYICGGSLISSTAVVTAAHCVTKAPSGRPVDADVLVVYLGKYHLHQFSDDGGVQNKQVRDVHVYPDYNNTNFHDDIAVLTLTSPIEYTRYVRPVCLWNIDDSDLNAVEGKEGTVVGWGYDENDQVTEELKMAHMPVVSQQTCIWSYPQFFSQFTSNKTYCAGFRKGTSVCNGDSGGGMVFLKESLWYLRGLVSITVARQGLRVCDTSHYVVFTDVAKYLSWIRQYIT